MPFKKSPDGSLTTAKQDLTLGNASLKRVDNGTEDMAINGLPAGASLIVWNGTGVGDVGGDWTATNQGSESPSADAGGGTNGWDSGAAAPNSYTEWDNGALLDVAGTYSTLDFMLQPKIYPNNGTLQIQWRNNLGTVIGATLLIENYVTNMDLDVWQQVSIPIADFNLGADVQRLRLVYKTGNPQQHYVDDIELKAAGGGGGPFTFRVQAPVGECWHASMLVVLFTAPEAGWLSDAFANITGGLANGLLLRQFKLSTSETIWQLNSKDNVDLFGRYHPQESFVFADNNLLVGFMVKPGKNSSVVVTDDEVLEFVVRDDLSLITSARAFYHYGIEIPEVLP
jgi:hypothetical protein